MVVDRQEHGNHLREKAIACQFDRALNRLSVVPSGLLALGGGLPVQQIEDHTPQDRQVVRGVAGVDTARVFPESYV